MEMATRTDCKNFVCMLAVSTSSLTAVVDQGSITSLENFLVHMKLCKLYSNNTKNTLSTKIRKHLDQFYSFTLSYTVIVIIILRCTVTTIILLKIVF